MLAQHTKPVGLGRRIANHVPSGLFFPFAKSSGARAACLVWDGGGKGGAESVAAGRRAFFGMRREEEGKNKLGICRLLAMGFAVVLEEGENMEGWCG